MEGTCQRPMCSSQVMTSFVEVTNRVIDQMSHLMTSRNAKTSYRLKSIHGHISPFSLILVGLDRD
jgi:hypothetical protein